MDAKGYKTYLENAHFAVSTIYSYMSWLNNSDSQINKTLRDKGIIESNIFEIDDLDTFNTAVSVLFGDADFMAFNREMHNNYSAAIRNLNDYVDEYKVFDKMSLPIEKISDMASETEEIADPKTKAADAASSTESPYPRNWIIFGAPGTGKSYTLNEYKDKLLHIDSTILNDKEDQYERVTFYPDYSYANFVGTYKPVPATDEKGNIVKDSNGNDVITYKYVPGPFMRIYVKAKLNPKNNYLLIIEEINRANAAAVFGDVFQLLDRDKDGVSEYSVQVSEDARNYLKEKLGDASDECSKIRIPSNMYIWATMNSADQGVYPLDTAFKRRWSFEYIGIDDAKGALSKKYVNLGKGKNRRHVKWDNLRMAINNFLSKEKINEDKQLGPYFIDPELIPNDAGINDKTQKFIDVFKDKVLMYLYEDAARQKRDKLFGESRYSDICSRFDESGVYVFKEVIWTEEQLASDLQGAQEQEEAEDEADA